MSVHLIPSAIIISVSYEVINISTSFIDYGVALFLDPKALPQVSCSGGYKYKNATYDLRYL